MVPSVDVVRTCGQAAPKVQLGIAPTPTTHGDEAERTVSGGMARLEGKSFLRRGLRRGERIEHGDCRRQVLDLKKRAVGICEQGVCTHEVWVSRDCALQELDGTDQIRRPDMNDEGLSLQAQAARFGVVCRPGLILRFLLDDIGREAKPEPGYCDDELPCVAAVLQNTAQTRDVLTEIVLRHDHIGPDCAQQGGLGDQRAALLQEIAQHFEGARSNRTGTTVGACQHMAP